GGGGSAPELVRMVAERSAVVSAPQTVGGVAGRLTFFLGEQMIGETDLLYAWTVPENRAGPTLVERVRNYLFRQRTNAALAVMGIF
ncbi:MAG: hypothetical protein K2F83_07720, partial [Oscillospiraceae bacterium]|nr:hypothetical protein [Oscillospiraceae bacterium]